MLKLKWMFAGAIGLSLFTTTFAKADNTKLYNKSYNVTHYTKYDMESMLKANTLKQHAQPVANENQIKDLPTAYNSNHQPLEVWDSWQLKNKNGQVANYHGYHIVFALTGLRSDYYFGLDNQIYLFYQKVGQNGVNSWKSAGPVFKNNQEGTNQSTFNNIKNENGQWSGSSAIINNKLTLYYTSVIYDPNMKSKPKAPINQRLASANIDLNVNQNGITINHHKTNNRHVIYKGDNINYETVHDNAVSSDEYTLRDPTITYANNKKYLIFEGNTGSKYGGTGYHTLYNRANIGGNQTFQNQQLKLYQTNSTIKDQSAYNNAAIGALELTANDKIKKIHKPLVVFNNVEDETERPSLVQYQNKWYLFTDMHGWHMSSPNVQIKNGFMLGFVSNNLLSGYKPVNKNGLVLYSNIPTTNRNYNYSYNVIQSANNPFVITNYANDISNSATGHATFGNSLLLNINNNQINLSNKILAQGQLTYGQQKQTHYKKYKLY